MVCFKAIPEHLPKIIEENHENPISIAGVRVKGSENTNKSFIRYATLMTC
jgi:hypothetical protein